MKKILILIAILIIPITTRAALSDGLMGYWAFDRRDTVTSSDTVGIVFDRSGNSENGILTNFASISSARIIGRLRQALTFDGSNDRVNQTITTNLSNSFTVSAWVYPTKSSTGVFSVQCIVSSEVASYSNYWFCLGPFDNSGLKMHFGLYEGTNNPLATNPTVITLNRWVHVVGVRDVTSDTVNLYVNGILVNSVNDTITSVPTYSDFNIGGQLNVANRFFGGRIDDVRLYSRALTGGEINALYRLGLMQGSR